MRARGFTLVELLVGTAVGAAISMIGVAFVVQQTRTMGATTELVELSESSRFGVERLTADLRMAGVGLGYTEAGSFAGLAVGTFQVGEVTFISNNRRLASGVTTDDLGILSALGGRATIARYDDAGLAEVCRGSTFKTGERLVFGSEDGLTARSVILDSLVPTTCMGDDCVGGCDLLRFSADDTFRAGPAALSASYAGGTASGQLEWVTWFVEDTTGTPRLRRAAGPCAALDATCGEVVAEPVETLQIRRWESRDGQWVDITDAATPPTTGARLRLDIELVARSRLPDSSAPSAVTSALESDLCFPSCGSPSDGYLRRRLATSVEIKNTGRGSYRRQP